MGLDLHTVTVLDGGAPPQYSNRIGIWSAFGIANGTGGGAGQVVSVAVAVPKSAGLPSSAYFVDVELSQDATYWISAKTSAGFTVNIEPRLAANTLAAGTFNVNVQC
jgi:hypothetical protein